MRRDGTGRNGMGTRSLFFPELLLGLLKVLEILDVIRMNLIRAALVTRVVVVPLLDFLRRGAEGVEREKLMAYTEQ